MNFTHFAWSEECIHKQNIQEEEKLESDIDSKRKIKQKLSSSQVAWSQHGCHKEEVNPAIFSYCW